MRFVLVFALCPLFGFAEQGSLQKLLDAINSLRGKEKKLPPLHWDDALKAWNPKVESRGRVFCWVSKEDPSLGGLVGDGAAVWGAVIRAGSEGGTVEAAFSAMMSDTSARALLLDEKHGWRYIHIGFENGFLTVKLVGVRRVGMSADAWVMLFVGALLLFGGVGVSLAMTGRKPHGA